MSRREEIENKTEALLKPIAEKNEVRIYDVEFVKEAGLSRDELEFMDEDERIEALEDAGLDPDDFMDEF